MRDYDFNGIVIPQGGTRPLMSKPPALQAARKWVQQVEDAVSEYTRDDGTLNTEALADWTLNAMERFGAQYARPVFDMEDNGPSCSHCGAWWPLCGHYHFSEVDNEEETPDA